ncbi:unnamed protein product, partial [Laminaria digitata]
RQLSRKATGGAASSRSRRDTAASAAASTPPIRRSEGPVPTSSGPAPLWSASKELDRRLQSHSLAGNSSTTDGKNGGGGPETNGLRAADAKANGKGTQGTATPGSSAAGHTHDKGYDKWTKFDIDAALRSVDEEGGTAHDKRYADSSSSSDSETDGDDSREAAVRQSPRRAPAVERRPSPPSPLPSPSLPTSQTPAPPIAGGTVVASRDLEREERERGNAKFGRGKFDEAIKSYTRCVGMNRKSSLAFSNRAMAYLKLKEFGKSEADSDAALRIDPRHVKSLQRRATARNALGKHRAALGDLQTASEIDPASKEIRKDLSKTLETLKTVVRRAPKRRVKVEGMPLPASKPRGFSRPRKNDEASLPADHDPAIAHAGGAATATSADAPATVDEGTIAPFSSVLHGEKDGNRGSEHGSRGARTTFEELPEEDAAPTTLPPPPEPAAATPLAPCDTLAAKPIAATRLEGRALGAVPSSTGIADSSTVMVATEVRAPTPIAVVEGTLPDSKRVAAVTRPPTAVAPDALRPETPKEKVVASSAARSESSALAGTGNCAKQTGITLRADACSGSAVAHVPGQETAARSTEGKPKTKKESTPSLKRSTAPSSAASPGTAARAQKLPTTGYQFEHMWRSTEGSLEARQELLRAIPPSFIPKIFRRTPLEVELLAGILRHLGAALLPRRPTTALRWLKSLPKASRFGMTVALLGEEDGRAAARELLARLEETPSVKVEPGVIDSLRGQYLLC